jgi:hypothetical protein
MKAKEFIYTNSTQETYKRFSLLHPIRNAILVRLTIKNNINYLTDESEFVETLDRKVITANLGYLLKQLNKAVLSTRQGRSKGQELKVVPIIDLNDQNGWLMHLIIERPQSLDLDAFTRLFKQCSADSDLGFHIAIAPIGDLKAGTNYVLKSTPQSEDIYSTVDVA